MRASGWGDAVLLDLRFRTELADELLHFLLLHPREQLLLDGVEGGELHGTDVIELDDVPAELGLYRRFGVFPLLQLGKRIGERLDERSEERRVGKGVERGGRWNSERKRRRRSAPKHREWP